MICSCSGWKSPKELQKIRKCSKLVEKKEGCYEFKTEDPKI